MIIVLLAYVLVVLFGIKFKLKGQADYLAVENTTAVKGIFILMVFMSHFNGYIEMSGSLIGVYRFFFALFGQAMVALFLFYSGYGIMESVKKKGDAYVSQIPMKRMLGTLFRFDCAIALFVLANLVCGYKLEFFKTLLAFTGWEVIGNSNWYIFVIIVLYFLAFLGFKIFKNKSKVFPAIFVAVVTAVLIAVTHFTQIKPSYWYDTAMIFSFGMFYSLAKEKIEKIFNKNILIWGITVLVSAAAYMFLRGDTILTTIIAYLLFTFGFVVATMRITFQNKVLKWCGDYLFEIYILQRLPMMILQRVGLGDFNAVVYFIACLGITVGFAILFKKYTQKAWNAITRK